MHSTFTTFRIPVSYHIEAATVDPLTASVEIPLALTGSAGPPGPLRVCARQYVSGMSFSSQEDGDHRTDDSVNIIRLG